MKQFARLYNVLDQISDEDQKIAALVTYFQAVEDAEKLYAIGLLQGKRPKRLISIKELVAIANNTGEIPNWLFEASVQQVGDVTETVSLVYHSQMIQNDLSLIEWINKIEALRPMSKEEQASVIAECLSALQPFERFVFNKLLVGGFRFEVSQPTMTNALSQFLELPKHAISYVLNQRWDPVMHTFEGLFGTSALPDNDIAPLELPDLKAFEGEESHLGNVEQWQFERYWHGIRCQLSIKNGKIYVWDIEGKYLSENVPELKKLLQILPDGIVIAGMLLGMKDGLILPVEHVISRVNRKLVNKKHMQDCPITFLSMDLLVYAGENLFGKKFEERKALLSDLIASSDKADCISYSPVLEVSSWSQVDKLRNSLRQYFSSGLLLKRKDGWLNNTVQPDYLVWKAKPFTIDAVLIYVARSFQTGKIEYTVATWSGELLVPVAKVESNLDVAQEKEIAEYAKSNTIEKFGPVRSIEPNFIFEISFDDIVVSKRHKCGIRLINPYISTVYDEKPIEKANTLPELHVFLDSYGESET